MTIPEDIIKEAEKIWLESASRNPIDAIIVIASAIMAERERCAKIAENRSDELFDDATLQATAKNADAFERQKNAAYDAKWIAEAIRR